MCLLLYNWQIYWKVKVIILKRRPKLSDFLKTEYRVKVIIFENMTGQKLSFMKRWTSKSDYLLKMTRQKWILLKRWPCKGIIFWKVETARVIIFEKMTEWKWLSRAKGWKGAAQPEASHQCGPSQKYCKLVLISYSIDINHTRGWNQYTRPRLSWI